MLQGLAGGTVLGQLDQEKAEAELAEYYRRRQGHSHRLPVGADRPVRAGMQGGSALMRSLWLAQEGQPVPGAGG